MQTVAHMFRIDEDLSAFNELVREDDLAWCALGAGRMLRAPTVFEDVVKKTHTNDHPGLARPSISGEASGSHNRDRGVSPSRGMGGRGLAGRVFR